MIKPKRGSKNHASSEMVVPFSLNDTLAIIESVQAQNHMFRHLTVTIHEHEDELIVFRVRFNLINVVGIGRFDCYGELNGDGAYNTTTLQWLPSKSYRKSSNRTLNK
ncbi:MAG: hypothetical protein RLP44_19550 [Aggregatilineales bacterium]